MDFRDEITPLQLAFQAAVLAGGGIALNLMGNTTGIAQGMILSAIVCVSSIPKIFAMDREFDARRVAMRRDYEENMDAITHEHQERRAAMRRRASVDID